LSEQCGQQQVGLNIELPCALAGAANESEWEIDIYITYHIKGQARTLFEAPTSLSENPLFNATKMRCQQKCEAKVINLDFALLRIRIFRT